MTNSITKRVYQKPVLIRAQKLGQIVASGSTIAVSDIRLKRDVELVSRREDGIGVYSYRYLLGEQRFIGVVAQEVAVARPDAVVTQADGFMAVDYARLGMTLQRAA
jgi:hypothetical protein